MTGWRRWGLEDNKLLILQVDTVPSNHPLCCLTQDKNINIFPLFVLSWSSCYSSPEKQNQLDVYVFVSICVSTYLSRKTFIVGCWLPILWRLRNHSISHLQTWDPGKPVVWLEGLRTGRAAGVDSSSSLKVWEPGVLRAEDKSPRSTVRQSEFILPLPSNSIQFLNRLNEDCPHWGGLSALLSTPKPLLISSRNTLTT